MDKLRNNHSRRRAERAGRSSLKRKPARPRIQFEWTKGIDDEQWASYRRAIAALREAGIPFLLGGGFALASYIGRWRNTKDIDLYLRNQDREAAVAALTKAGFADYYSTLSYDRRWIYRSTRAGVIVDIIWAMANQRAQVDEAWFTEASEVVIRGETLRVVPIEEFFWCKLYIMQRDHCDWVDVFNLLYAAGPRIDWARLFRRLDSDWPLLRGLLSVYGWLCPSHARRLPASLMKKLKLSKPEKSGTCDRDRIRLLDSRAWFSAILPKDRLLEV